MCKLDSDNITWAFHNYSSEKYIKFSHGTKAIYMQLYENVIMIVRVLKFKKVFYILSFVIFIGIFVMVQINYSSVTDKIEKKRTKRMFTFWRLVIQIKKKHFFKLNRWLKISWINQLFLWECKQIETNFIILGKFENNLTCILFLLCDYFYLYVNELQR